MDQRIPDADPADPYVTCIREHRDETRMAAMERLAMDMGFPAAMMTRWFNTTEDKAKHSFEIAQSYMDINLRVALACHVAGFRRYEEPYVKLVGGARIMRRLLKQAYEMRACLFAGLAYADVMTYGSIEQMNVCLGAYTNINSTAQSRIHDAVYILQKRGDSHNVYPPTWALLGEFIAKNKLAANTYYISTSKLAKLFFDLAVKTYAEQRKAATLAARAFVCCAKRIGNGALVKDVRKIVVGIIMDEIVGSNYDWKVIKANRKKRKIK